MTNEEKTNRIQKAVGYLDEFEKETIKDFLNLHGNDKEAAAERISTILNVNQQVIFELI